MKEWIVSADGRAFPVENGQIFVEYKGKPPKDPVRVVEKLLFEGVSLACDELRAEVQRLEEKLIAVAKDRDQLRAEVERLHAAWGKPNVELFDQLAEAKMVLEALYKRHLWHPDMGECICDAHADAAALLAKLDRGEK